MQQKPDMDEIMCDVESYFDSYESRIHHFPFVPITWRDIQHGENYFILLYKAKFWQINYELHHYSFTETNAIYHKQYMQYINVHGDYWILCHV
jgi:hypothetical protein